MDNHTPTENSHASVEACFKRDDMRGIWPFELNAEVARLTGRAMAELLAANADGKKEIVLGHDARLGSFDLLTAFAHGVEEAGGRCTSIGLASTEQVYYACGRYADRFAGGAMVTASHNPRDYNGLKMMRSGAVPFSAEDLAFIRLRVLQLLEPVPVMPVGEEFAEYMLHLAGFDAWKPLGCVLKIVVMAGNGVGAVAFRPIAKQLEVFGLDTVFVEDTPDGTFPRGVPNPLLPDFNKRLAEAVKENKADLGIGFDGDADRAGFVDHTGTPVEASHILALVSQRKLAACKIHKPVVLRNICGSQLLKHLFPAGGDVELIDLPVGHGQFKRLMRHEAFSDRVVFAGEHSGHYFHPDFFCADSGMLTALHLIAQTWQWKAAGETLADKLVEWRNTYHWSGELNYDLKSREDIQATIVDVAKEFGGSMSRYEIRKDEELDLNRCMPAVGGYDATKLAAPDLKLVEDNGDQGWWFCLRPSGNEPKLRLNVETWNRGDLADLTGRVIAVLKKHGATEG